MSRYYDIEISYYIIFSLWFEYLFIYYFINILGSIFIKSQWSYNNTLHILRFFYYGIFKNLSFSYKKINGNDSDSIIFLVNPISSMILYNSTQYLLGLILLGP